MSNTLFDKVWDSHVVNKISNGPDVLFIDRHMVHEVTSPVAFLGLKKRNTNVLFPEKTFSGKNIYKSLKGINSQDIEQRISSFWSPYHKKIHKILSEKKAKYGYALLWDAHSIKTFVPDLFEGRLPDLNIGTNSGETCPKTIEDAVLNIALRSRYSVVSNERFKGGFITRNYGNPKNHIYAIQLEIAQSCYMDETSLTYNTESAKKLIITLEKMLKAFMLTAKKINFKN